MDKKLQSFLICLIPLALTILFFIAFVIFMVVLAVSSNYSSDEVPIPLVIISLTIFCIFFIYSVGLMIYYMKKVLNNDILTNLSKGFWLLVIFLYG
jgi:hypothetical protein